MLFTPVIETVDMARTLDRETGTGSKTNGGRYTKIPGDTPSGFTLIDFFLINNLCNFA